MGKAEARPKWNGGGSGSGSGSPGKIFVGGLPRDTSDAMFVTHFGQYGEIIDSVIMKDKFTSQPRGFGFITYSNPAVVDKVMADIHVINGKQVEIKRTIPKGSMQSNSKDFKTKKIFVGGLRSTLTEDDFKNFFTKYGTVVDHQIMHDHETKCSRGFGFIVFASEQIVDDLLANGSMIDLAGSKVEIKKAEPKKSSNPQQSAYCRKSRPGYDSEPPRGGGGFCSELGSFDQMGEFGGGYGRYRYYAGLEGFGGALSFGYPSRFGLYGGGFDRAYAVGDLSGYRLGGAHGSFGGPGSSGFGGAACVGNSVRGGYGVGRTPDRNGGSFTGGSSRYHPYGL